MKNIVTISIIRDEGDIIESFCRYALTFSDSILIYVRDGNSDNSKQILQKLMEEGLPIHFADDIASQYTKYAGNELKQIAIDTLGADLILRCDADEFLYHIDGLNPRSTLEGLSEDVEYHALWRNYVYHNEPNHELFLPCSFTHYRNPVLEQFERHKKTIASRYLFENQQAEYRVPGAHYLTYPSEFEKSAKVQVHPKLVYAHFPVRSSMQIKMKAILKWIGAWRNGGGASFAENLKCMQIGSFFEAIKEYGEIPAEIMRLLSIEYSILSLINNISRDELNEIESDLGDDITIYDPMNLSFCSDKIQLRYTNLAEISDKLFLKALAHKLEDVVPYVARPQEYKNAFMTSRWIKFGKRLGFLKGL